MCVEGSFHFLITAAVEVVVSWPGEIVLGRGFQIVVCVGCVVVFGQFHLHRRVCRRHIVKIIYLWLLECAHRVAHIQVVVDERIRTA